MNIAAHYTPERAALAVTLYSTTATPMREIHRRCAELPGAPMRSAKALQTWLIQARQVRRGALACVGVAA